VVDVDDVVADLQVAEVGEERVRLLLPAPDARRRGRLEQVPLGVRDQPQLVEDETASDVAGSDGELAAEGVLGEGDVELLEEPLDLLPAALGGGEEDLLQLAALDVRGEIAEAIAVAVRGVGAEAEL
jgi:hypothetical protein